MKKKITLFLSFFLLGWTAKAQVNVGKKIEVVNDPAIIGKKVAENVIHRRFGWRYQRVCAYYGSLIFSDVTHDPAILEKVKKGYHSFSKGLKFNLKGHVDYNVFGIWPFEIYRQTGDAHYLEKPKFLADHEFEKLQEDGLSSFTRFWIDDMYMVGSLQVQAYKSLKDTVYLNRAAKTIKVYCEKLQRPNGMFYHRADAPFYWGRGNGWAAAAFAEIIPVLPQDHIYYQDIKSAFQKMMKTIATHQDEEGMWHQLLDDPDSYPETSCTGMFLYALATGIDYGWLDVDDYGPKVSKGWDALAGYVNDKGETENVCIGTNAKDSRKHYLTRPTSTGNFHGQAAVLWSATAILRLKQD
ncbi:glycoside hydrolase family 88/105 protein [Flexithrix dorotheae]|uniref:glycoside hydrolase family 88/105 protein n=1 Tax=Flexithrix dorotheae TaxID=70993 RepID=UPI00036BC143|nr:glycoside hydrolase family 88 protein [Flexithrix dorotheae]